MPKLILIAFLFLLASCSSSIDNDGFTPIFNGKDLNGWSYDPRGRENDYIIKDGCLVSNSNRNIYSAKNYGNFILKFDFLLPPEGNNGLGIRMPFEGDAKLGKRQYNPAYASFEIQLMDNSGEKYKKLNLKPQQYHGSIYGIHPAKRGFQKPVGQWNSQEVLVDGTHVKVTLNGTVILDCDLQEIENSRKKNERSFGQGLLRKSGRIVFTGHGKGVTLRNICIKEI